ncbi:flagellar biosynthetic protein FliO [Paucibacter sp. KCTC 42545]|uniref:flagellar biosynthetic protein FliO n=1 Tax=Paucibacter sp. KCTC 42545 TaxID=1768242 RepID=UPI000733AA00|nr:flagellar biosynthetic protein FliO [Paucibacter sp. KCTC 42545]ALT76553.1 flagellar biogenesis protein [Paucibacter sp. KCTC 42545]
MNSPFLPFLWFLAILCLIPLALWLLKRSPMGGSLNPQGVMRVVAQLPISPNQKLLTVEVGQGDQRRWLVLGVTAQQICTLHEMAPQAEATESAAAVPFAQMLGARLRGQGAAKAGEHDAS